MTCSECIHAIHKLNAYEHFVCGLTSKIVPPDYYCEFLEWKINGKKPELRGNGNQPGLMEEYNAN